MSIEKKTKKNKQNVPILNLPQPDLAKKHFPKFVVLESKEETPLAKIFPFIIHKVISSLINPKSAKKKKKQKEKRNYPYRSNKKNSEILLKMKKFHQYKIISYPHNSLNRSKGMP